MKTLSTNFFLCFFFLFSFTLTAQQLHVTNPAAAVQEAVLVDNPANTEGVLILNTAGGNVLPALEARSAGPGAAVHGDNSSSGPAVSGLKTGGASGVTGRFINSNAANMGSVLFSTTSGTGHAGDFNITNPTNSLSVIYGTTSGTGPGVEGEITNAANASAAVSGVTNGLGAGVLGENTGTGTSVRGIKQAVATGHSGYFSNTNAANPSATLAVESNSGMSAAIKGVHTGMGPAGLFEVHAGNTSAAVLGLGLDGPGVEAINDGAVPSLIATKRAGGTGPAAVIENMNAANGAPTLVVINAPGAPGPAVDVAGNTVLMGNTFTKNVDIINDVDPRPAAIVVNSMTAHPGLHVVQDHMANPPGGAPALFVEQKSDGGAAIINILNPANGVDAVTASTDGTGSAGSFSVVHPTSMTSSLIGIHGGPGAGVEGANSSSGHSVLGTKGIGATGHAGHFQNFDGTNPDPTVKIINANLDPAAFALDVDGNAIVSGDVDVDDLTATTVTCAGVKCFRIDHPLDPQNKYLRHASIESSEMLNIYTGNVVLGKRGKATIALPDWFEALNTDFRYNLTCIGGFAKVYVSKEIKNGKFQIAGGKKGMKISWQVSGVRHDQFAKENPLQVEALRK